MPAANPLIMVIRAWVAKAENDLKNGAHTLTLGAECPTDTVCFHAQQCVEKYIKALLVFRATPFRKTHDIYAVRSLLPPRLRPSLVRKDQKLLTQYATVRRYPLGPDITLSEARRAVALARRVRREIRRHLPAAPCAGEGNDGSVVQGLQPQREIKVNRSFNPDEFAIHLEQVVAKTSPEDYREPAQFI